MTEGDPMRWVWRAITGSTLVLGWLFILWQNKFHVTVPVVIICLGYLAVVATIANLWRVGAAAVAPEDDSPDAWARPIGPRADLEKEKKTLLKAIKEAEFDHAMGKLSKADADDLIHNYRARAIAVIKELDRLEAGHAESPREQIQREVQARLALAKDRPNKKDKKDRTPAKADAKAAPAKADAAKAGSARADAKTGSARADAAKAGGAHIDAKAGSAKSDEAKTDAAQADTAQADTAQPTDAKADPASQGASPIDRAVEPPEQDTAEATS